MAAIVVPNDFGSGVGGIEAGLNPVVTVTEACEGALTADGRARLLAFLRECGLAQPRLKVLPLLRLGAEATRSRAYAEWESLAGRELTADEAEALQCSSCRMVTSRGVLKERIWGGRNLEKLYKKTLPSGIPVGESWEVSDRPGDERRRVSGD